MCLDCSRTYRQLRYLALEGDEQRTRTARNRHARLDRDPAYRRAYNLWNSTKKRNTVIPPWVSITDFLPICHVAVELGDGWVIDHKLPINGELVCGLHVPENLQVIPRESNRLKGNR